MAVYPEGNPGEFPLDPTSDVGKFRLTFGDTQSEAYSPVESGFQNYTYFSDAEIGVFLVAGDDSIPRGVGYAYLQLAGAAAMDSESVKDYDLAVDTTKRSGDLRAIAQYWFDRADTEADLSGDAFDIVPMGDGCDLIPELSQGEWGRRYVPYFGRWGC